MAFLKKEERIDMITVEEAIKIYKNNNPDKVITNILEWKNKYVFCDKRTDNETDWDSSLFAVSMDDGTASRIDIFDMDFIKNAKEIMQH